MYIYIYVYIYTYIYIYHILTFSGMGIKDVLFLEFPVTLVIVKLRS